MRCWDSIASMVGCSCRGALTSTASAPNIPLWSALQACLRSFRKIARPRLTGTLWKCMMLSRLPVRQRDDQLFSAAERLLSEGIALAQEEEAFLGGRGSGGALPV